MMNEYNYGTMDESSLSSHSYHSGDFNDNHDQLRLMQVQEANDFAAYDQAMYDAVYYDNHQEYDYEYEDNGYVDSDDNNNDAIMWDDEQNVYYDQQDNDNDQQEEDNHDDSALLRLILDVQVYLGESTTASRFKDDTPLMDLQYKMYTYMKLRALELGIDPSSLY